MIIIGQFAKDNNITVKTLHHYEIYAYLRNYQKLNNFIFNMLKSTH